MNKYRILDIEFIDNYIRKNFPNGNLIGVEIGSLAGESAEALVLSGNFNKFYCVDPWKTDMIQKIQIITMRRLPN